MRHAHHTTEATPQEQSDALEAGLAAFDALTTDSRVVLQSLGATLLQLTRTTAPIHAKASALTTAQANIDAAKSEADKLLQSLERVGKVRPRRIDPGRRSQMVQANRHEQHSMPATLLQSSSAPVFC